LRTAQERDLLDVEGAKSAVIEVQGALYFGTTEQLLRYSRAQRDRPLYHRRLQARAPCR
jgi:hypothetical protein